ncbi:MAG TPA: trypsin-like peptidase domain-containing protein [Longimicrobiales bacterium]|nr:trypsin-like peptidase domain-containing protein [Longimicrobiales bacterium]
MRRTPLLPRRAATLLAPLPALIALCSLPAHDLTAQSVEAAAQASAPVETPLEVLAARVTPAVALINVQTDRAPRQGSGFLVSPDGRILTNYHVIRDARSARVKLASGDVYEEVKVLATDPRRDIAILQIAGFDLPYLEMGNSDSVRVGQPVVVIGSPLGLENTVSTGIVSGRRHEPEGYQLLQMSAPASRGSSGGAVLGSHGQVVGIATSQIDVGQNLNFAVPINYARGLLSHLGGEPIAVLRPVDLTANASDAASVEEREDVVNAGLSYGLEDFVGYTIETEMRLGEDRQKRTRVTYRLIETVTGAEPLIERYLESETTKMTEPFGTVLTLGRERSRVVVHVDGLRPVSARGETATWNGSAWAVASHELRFTGDRVAGVVTDTTGNTRELDSEVPAGILLQDMRDLAFAMLQAGSLVGRSVQFTTFSPRTGTIDQERYDVLGTETVQMDGASYRALRVNVALGLDNETFLVRADRPRTLLRRTSGDGSEVEVVTSVQYERPSKH